ncbi:MAG: hypothetical protein Q4B68_05525 [Bacteroidales bacterium]|nr:hypothetical protein [Bacteroidales bacterium]
MNNIRSISRTDVIMANLSWNGQTLANVSKSDFTSIDDVVKLISTMAGKCFGIAKLCIRNKTQGWAVNMAISTPKTPSMQKPLFAASAPRGTQFALQF